MTDEIKKADLAREERMRQQATEKAKPKSKESEFDKLVKSGQLSQQATTMKIRQKPVTERAIHEAAKKEQREKETRRKEKDEKKEKKGSREEQTREGGKITDQKVVGKGRGKEGGRGGGEGRGGFSGSTTKRGLSKKLFKAGVKTLPADLQQKFAAKLIKAQGSEAASRAQLTQQMIDKLVNYVRLGINREGEKEIQIDLHERIFRGLKLRVTAQGGKVGVHFRTSDVKGREVFERNRETIMSALAEKGIEVVEFTIA